MRTVDETEIRRAVQILHGIDDKFKAFEVRIIDGRWNMSGYFEDADTLIRALTDHAQTSAHENIYITLNPLKSGTSDRKQKNCFVKGAEQTTGDGDIEGLLWLMIDLDPDRASGVSSSDAEFEAAHDKAKLIYKYLRAIGWNDPVIAESGNGVHLLYRVKLQKTDENTELLKNCLAALDAMFSDDAVKVDVKTYNPARVCKLYGTMAKKGADTQERPHRMSRILYAPDTVRANDKTLLQALAANVPQLDPPMKSNDWRPSKFDLREWIARNGVQVKKEIAWQGGTKFVLECCPFNPQHKGKDAALIQTGDGKICYNCFHASCAGNHWREFRLRFEPDAYDHDKQQVQDHWRPNYQRETTRIEPQTGEPVMLTTEQIRNRKRPPEEFLPSGIVEIDKALRGLKKGYVTLLSGLRASGKSSLINQIAMSVIQNGYKAALFSGELTAENVMRWLYLQAAGKVHTLPTRYENYYMVTDDTKERISKWLDEKLYIYNNDYGNVFEDIQSALIECVETQKVDLIILDNLMAMDLSRLDRDRFVQQSLLVNELEIMAKKYNVHIIFVAHPRKTNGFLRLQDVSGSNDIVNRVDNAIIMHRVNEDFKREVKSDLHWKDDNPNFGADNVIEICKDRDGGTQDKFIPLYFERESKRLKNEPAEVVVYGWDIGQTVELPF